MLVSNNNKTFIKTLSNNCLKANKMRNRIAMLAIILTAVLFTALSTVMQGTQFSMKEQQIRQSGTRFMSNVKYLTLPKAKEIMKNPVYTDTGLMNSFALAANDELADIRTILTWAEENAVEKSFMKPDKGRLPQKVNEIACDSEVLKAFGLPYKTGAKIDLQYMIGDKIETVTMTVSGIWKGQKYESMSQILVSEEFLKQNLDKGSDLQKVSESYMVYGSFSSAKDMESKLKQVVKDAGYNPDAERGEEGFVPHNVNAAYKSQSDISPATIASGVLCILFVLLGGYLIIYNIFRISVMKDIRLYGQLKTIGASPKQIKYMISRQGMKLALIGIPIGLIMGWLLGNLLLPIVMKTLIFNQSVFVMPNVFVWLFSAAFTAGTVWISTNKPGKMAGRISPVDAMRYQESDKAKKTKSKGQESRNRILQMAYANLGRNKGKTVLVILSLSISILLLNCLLNVTGSFDKQTYLSREVTADFDVTSKQFLRYTGEEKDNIVPQKTAEAIESIDGIKDFAKVYYKYPKSEEENISGGNMSKVESINGKTASAKELGGDALQQVYGYDENAFATAQLIEGTIDYEKLKSGNYAVAAGSLDDRGGFDNSELLLHAGDSVEVTIDGKKKTVEILAVIGVQTALQADYSTGGYLSLVFSEEVFQQDFPSFTDPLHCVFNAKEGMFDKVNAAVQDIGKTTNIKAATKISAENAYYEIISTYNAAGGILAFIFGIIGILNLLNVIMTGAIARQGEFATMRSIGMTRKQLKKLFTAEGILYAAAAGVAGIIISAVLSLTVVKGLASALWFSKYYFTVIPALCAAAICVICAATAAVFVDRIWNRGNIVENLRKVE